MDGFELTSGWMDAVDYINFSQYKSVCRINYLYTKSFTLLNVVAFLNNNRKLGSLDAGF